MSSFNKELASKKIQDCQGSMSYRKIKIFESLLKAVKSNNVQDVKEILASGININDMSKNSQTALHLAAGLGHDQIAKLLISNGAKIYTKDNSGFTPLHYAVWFNQLKIVKLLIEKRANINEVTPLDLAVKKSLDDIVKLLISHGADTSMKDFDGNSLLHLAVKDQKISIVKTLVEAEKCLHEKNLHGLKSLEHDLVLRKDLRIAKVFMYLQ